MSVYTSNYILLSVLWWRRNLEPKIFNFAVTTRRNIKMIKLLYTITISNKDTYTTNFRVYSQVCLSAVNTKSACFMCLGTKTKRRLRGIRPCWHGVTPAASSTTPLRRIRQPGAWSRSGSTWLHWDHPWSRGWTSLSGQSIPVLSAAVRKLTEMLKWIDIVLHLSNL